MKKYNYRGNLRTLSLLLLLASMRPATAQTQMKVTLTDGSSIQMPLSSISDISVEPVVPEALAQLAGHWQLIAMPNGTTGEGGILTATPDTIAFTATVAPDGMGLVCRAERFFTRSGNVYPATWRMLLEENAASGRQRIGWVLDASAPASEKEFDEPREKYLDNGLFYWGVNSKRTDGDTGHRYIYLLTENIETQRLEGYTLWSSWLSPTATEYVFPQNQEVYGVVALDIPYNYYGYSDVGYFEIWASPRFVRVGN